MFSMHQKANGQPP